ncbi:uncharacterized protein LOC142178104 [Nicotiana tabacum]|uniref:Uncharacterized protein LOC142178104 n=1 Tax=Nicotiana tabacum TaxID=4097 RepID=A0AC58U223_TOBAC
MDKQFGHFLEVIKQVYVNLLSQMPTYAKFLKERLSNKQKVEETSVVKLIEHCSAILQNKLRKKYRDLGSFTIPFSIGSTNFEKSLCDSGASINLMLVRVDKFAFPVDFIVVNMEENKEVPLILGRPIFATDRAILDIQERQLMLRVGEERVLFKMKEAIGAPKEEFAALILR